MCPIDLLYEKELVRGWYIKETENARGIIDKVTNWYLRRHVDKLFACSAKSIEIAENEKINPFEVNMADVDRALERIIKAESPVMIIGSQATLRPEILDQLAEQLKAFGVPVYLTGMARGLLGDKCPLQFRHGRSQALKTADLVLFPELSLCGNVRGAHESAMRRDDERLVALAREAGELGLVASVGFFERDGDARYVSQAWLEKGAVLSVYRKIFCCEGGGSDGGAFEVVDWKGIRTATIIFHSYFSRC